MAVTGIYTEPIVDREGWPDVQITMQNTELPEEQRQVDIGDVMERVWQSHRPRLDALIADYGTRVSTRSDLRIILVGTMPSPTKVHFDVAPTPLVPPTRMARIRQLADLSLREWAGVFGVTHTAIRQWLSTEPDREKLSRVAEALEEAARYHGNLVNWLRRPLPGTAITPLDLLRRDSWRAFRGSLRAGTAPAVTISGQEMRRRRQAEESWAVPEAPAVGDE